MYQWFYILSWIILLPAIIGIIKYSIITSEFKPLAINIWLGVAAEIAATILRYTVKNNFYAYNIFMLFDLVTMLCMFNAWGAFAQFKKVQKQLILVLFGIIWMVDNLVLNNLGNDNVIFRLCYSLALVLIAINQLSNIYIRNNGFLSRNPYLYTCLGVIFYYAFSAFIYLINSSLLFTPGPALWKYTLLIYVIINIVTNLLYATALIWIQKKAKSI